MAQKKHCDLCGRKGRRACPSINGSICAVCCGEKRGSELECPASCPHFPFGTEAFDLHLKVDEAWTAKVLAHALARRGRSHMLQTFKRFELKELKEEDADLGMLVAAQYMVSVERDDAGRTLADAWEEEDDWKGLNNDERYNMRYRRHTLPSVIEVQRVVSDSAVECMDLLDPDRGAFTVMDSGLAGDSARYSRWLAWATHYPFFSRLAGVGLQIPTDFFEEYIGEIRSLAGEASGAQGNGHLRNYMAEHFPECCERLHRMVMDKRQRMVQGMDLSRYRAFYRMKKGRSAVKQTLQGKPEFEEEDRDPEPGDPEGAEHFVWIRRGESKAIEKELPSYFQYSDSEEEGVGILGSLRLAKDEMMVEVFTKTKFEFAKKMVERFFGGAVEFLRESKEDMTRLRPAQDAEGSEAGEKEGEFDEEALLRDFYRRHYTRFLDDKIPMIDHMTPREAAKDSAMRPRLIELMKQHLNSVEQAAHDQGVDVNIDWVARELGLHELLD